MGMESTIGWTNCTWNPWQGCTKVSEACTNCYMFADLRRYGRDPTVVRKSKDPTFFLPLKRRRSGEYALPPGSKVFTCSWSDWFHERADPWRPKAWSIIEKRPDLVFQIVTKRTDRIAECLPPNWGNGWPHVWLIATVENQHWAEKRVPELVSVPAAVHGLSCEPLLGPIELPYRHHLEWVIAGGESGPRHRETPTVWFESLADQCEAAGVPYFQKQDSGPRPGLRGRLSDRLWNLKQFPAVAA